MGAHYRIRVAYQPIKDELQGNRYSDDHPARPQPACSTDGSEHGVAGGKSIIDEDGGLPVQRKRQSVTTIKATSSHELLPLAVNSGVQQVWSGVHRVDRLLIEHYRSIGGDCAHRKLGLSGSANLVDEQHIEPQRERTGGCCGYWNPTSRQSQEDGLVLAPVIGQQPRQQLARMPAITKHTNLDAVMQVQRLSQSGATCTV